MDNRTAYILGWAYGRIYAKIPDEQKPGPGAITFAHQCPFVALGQLHRLGVQYAPPGSVLDDDEITAAFDELPSEIESQPKGIEWESYWAKGYYSGKLGKSCTPPRFDIKDRRRIKGLSQDELAKMMGVSREQVSRWENGANDPNEKNMEKLKSILL